jgi:hypothetical protein
MRKTSFARVTFGILLALASTSALAQQGPQPPGAPWYGPGPWWGDGYGWSLWWMCPLMFLLMLAVMAAVMLARTHMNRER